MLQFGDLVRVVNHSFYTKVKGETLGEVIGRDSVDDSTYQVKLHGLHNIIVWLHIRNLERVGTKPNAAQ